MRRRMLLYAKLGPWVWSQSSGGLAAHDSSHLRPLLRLVDAWEKETSRQVAEVPWSAKARDAQRVPRKARERADVRNLRFFTARVARAPPSWRSLASLRHGARSLLAMRGIASTRRCRGRRCDESRAEGGCCGRPMPGDVPRR